VTTGSVAAAYSAIGDTWQGGPGRIYDRLAEVLVSLFPVPVRGARALDLGAGTGAATRALLAAGASQVVAADAAAGMLAFDAAHRPPAVVADALALPFPDGSFDVTVAAFSLNHLRDPAAGVREAARVTRRGGAVLASAYAADDVHPVKGAVASALAAWGWAPEPWYEAIQATAIPKLASVDAGRSAAAAAGLVGGDVLAVRVPFPELDRHALVEWRLGMAQHAGFVAALSPQDRDALVADAIRRLGDRGPVFERSIIVVRAVRP
jgi:ubiquinone/menaquinone biosynthesis C-methylase UbiE